LELSGGRERKLFYAFRGKSCLKRKTHEIHEKQVVNCDRGRERLTGPLIFGSVQEKEVENGFAHYSRGDTGGKGTDA